MTRHEDDRQAMGAPTMQCFACHPASNTHDGRVPGAPNWHLAPLSMGWEDLRTDKALCEALKDPSRKGNKDVEHLVEHMTSDALVQWAWSPGTRVPPTVSQESFHRVVSLWARSGAACPRSDGRRGTPLTRLPGAPSAAEPLVARTPGSVPAA